MYSKIISLVVVTSLVLAEPPVGYNYRPPSNSYELRGIYKPSNSYLPPNTGYLPPSPSYLPPAPFGSSLNQAPSYNPLHDHHDHSYDHSHEHSHDHDNQVPKSYQFGYSVKDAKSGNDYNRKETSDGNEVKGEYRVQLPDGRTQIVTYHADWKTGYHADVRYEGEAVYPEPTNNQFNYNKQGGGYIYNPPSYTGSLTGFGNSFNSHNKPFSSYKLPGYP